MPKDIQDWWPGPRWNSEAARVSGVLIKKISADTDFKGYTHHASREGPQYLIKSDQQTT